MRRTRIRRWAPERRDPNQQDRVEDEQSQQAFEVALRRVAPAPLVDAAEREQQHAATDEPRQRSGRTASRTCRTSDHSACPDGTGSRSQYARRSIPRRPPLAAANRADRGTSPNEAGRHQGHSVRAAARPVVRSFEVGYAYWVGSSPDQTTRGGAANRVVRPPLVDPVSLKAATRAVAPGHGGSVPSSARSA